ncbi:LysR family transcriptional regulator ArgP [Colwellia sp. BRX10-3]|uniref:LysR family transcriptional regulator ArgP n=1 Tax=Colwellia sp. BRX10-3 TaxID=2759844 RepID=UPI0015F3EF8B|nr:LysR family transcriptional regulator ArgP [Colwellia sp. BRX10-3]MBA6391905.1 LysR family transcriptional regulator ArgP [Colwellia sp. BRX10-3]
MLDYKLLHALSVVVDEQNFDKAASVLAITQSAVSQRIKSLEQTIGQPVLIRAQPIVATAIGKKLLAHYQQVKLLEQDIIPDISGNNKNETITANIASNADSLATWLIAAIGDVCHEYNVAVNFRLADENRTINYLKNGEVFGALSTHQHALPGCTLNKLGDMQYLLVASPSFIKSYFPDGINEQSLAKAPAVAYDQKDDMHIKYIEQTFSLKGGSYPCHTVRSSEAFVNFAKQGLAYCLIPKLQIQTELAVGELINLMPDNPITRTLYWHHWVLLKGVFKAFSISIIARARHALNNQ